ncbi:RIO1 family protein [Cardiosporidium cionae]|uniref:non-specific serine/threonine protein kinase n=1 Tax=Cardiosporidium cionae TaxID=476202 RepID=A0ABQ7JDM1_9APIC|nr:RIO1 family protein [Cardiosporidium cionae]|eukprot:KAF8822126.1 RIO1 family protein [Cardiosporidium cionae]
MAPGGLTQDTRATAGLVLDPQTIRLLFELQKRGMFSRLMGCVSTGKEANVFRAELFDNTFTRVHTDPSYVNPVDQLLESSSPDKDTTSFTENAAKFRFDGKDHDLSIPFSEILRIRKKKKKVLSSTGTSLLAVLSGMPSQHTRDTVITVAHNDDSLLNSSCSMSQLAVKVFKTSILVFKDRSKYVDGDFRFRMGYHKSRNPRKMVRQWAEKEFRNLRRCHLFGVRCPIAIGLRGHVLVMRYLPRVEGMTYEAPVKDAFIDGGVSQEEIQTNGNCTLAYSSKGDSDTNLALNTTEIDSPVCSSPIAEAKDNTLLSFNGSSTFHNFGYSNLNVAAEEKSLLSPAPKLKEIRAPVIEWYRLYVEVICSMRQMYQQAHLVHGDLSEFNILYYCRHPYIIDVSQAVEHDHPNSMEFLKLDCQNVTSFFQSVISKASCKKDDFGKDLSDFMHEELVTLCGVDLSQCSIFSIRELFDFVINPVLPFPLSHDTIETHSSDKIYWPEFDKEERLLEYESKHIGRSATPQSSLSKSNAAFVTGEHKNTKRESILRHRQFLAYLCRCTAKYLFEVAQRESQVSECAENSVEIKEQHTTVDNQDCLQESIDHLSGDLVSDTTEELAENSLSETELEESVFLNSWIPSHLHQLSDLSQIEKDMDRYNRGETLFYERLLQQKRSQSTEKINNLQKEDLSYCKLSETVSEDEISEKEDAASILEASLKDTPHIDSQGEVPVTESSSQAEIKFNGVIPEGVDKKEWKKMIKEMNKERRKTKISKYVKKKNRKNAHKK